LTASQPPLTAELTARFPDWSAQDIEALMADHGAEIEVLNRYILEADLERRVKEVAELVSNDIANEAEDEDMDM
jgi:nuclear pore complex protein Nup133